jgi:hypothetical protein
MENEIPKHVTHHLFNATRISPSGKCLTALIFIVASGTSSLACSCMFTTPSEGFDRAKAVFTGTVVAAGKSKWTVAVKRVWKGEIGSQVVLFDAHAGTSCATKYEVGKKYLFLVNIEEVDGRVRYSPQVCNWGARLRSHKVIIREREPAKWIEDWVLMGHGPGHAPSKPWNETTAKHNWRLERSRHERASLLSCVGEPLKRSVMLSRNRKAGS